jgi:dCTP deaminase
MYLNKNEINKALAEEQLHIRPLLDQNQVTNISVNLRLGCDFLVSIKCRDPFIDETREHDAYENVYKFYQETRRQIGETFFLHPNQTIMAPTLEYIKLPKDLMATIDVRSSYARLGLTMNSFLEPGYCGCISVVLTNTSMNPIKLAVGARIFTIKFSNVSDDTPPYFSTNRKYMCQVRPVMSNISDDKDLNILESIRKGL